MSANNTSSLSTPFKPPRQTKNGIRLSRFVFTLNNYTPEEYNHITIGFPGRQQPKWMIVGKEVGEEGTPHLQGAVILGKQVAFNTVKSWPGFGRAHIESMKGQPIDSKVYCSKMDAFPFEIGEFPMPGKRTDIMVAVEAINNGMTLREMAMGDHGVAVVKFHKGLTALRSLRSAPRSRTSPPRVYWLYGPTGCGKTASAWDFAAAHGPDSDVFTDNGTLQWFDGYDGQSVVIIDDFRSKGVSFAFLLRILDRYPMHVPYKGGFVNWNPSVILITTPLSIRDTFQQRVEHRPEDVQQLERRITRMFAFPLEYDEFRGLIGTLGSESVQPKVRTVVDVTDERSIEDTEVFSDDVDLEFDP